MAALVATSAVAAPPAKRFDIRNAGISIALPGNWKQQSNQSGWKYVAARPDGQGKFYVESYRESTGYFAFRATFEDYVRKAAKVDDPRAKFETKAVKVGGERAIEIVARYGVLTAYAYGFVHARDDYIVEYVTATAYLGENFPVFAASVRSLRFLPAS